MSRAGRRSPPSPDRIDAAPVARAGRLACFCPPGAPSPGSDLAASLDEARWSPGVATLAAGFALSVLSQSLALGVLPLAGRLLAPTPILMAAPYIAMLLGAATATFPASFLLDAFGRRAALALGGQPRHCRWTGHGLGLDRQSVRAFLPRRLLARRGAGLFAVLPP